MSAVECLRGAADILDSTDVTIHPPYSGAIDNPCENETEYTSPKKVPEPLDEGTEDHYALHEPIANFSEVVARDRYLDDGQPMTADDAVGQYFKRRTTDATSRKTQGFMNGRRGTAENQYKRGMAMERQVLDQFENPTLTMLSLSGYHPSHRSA